MRAPSAAELLNVWERAINASPTARALAILAAAFPQAPTSVISELPIGVRDRHLLRLRERLFGLNVEGVSQCPRCQERLELEFSLHDVGLDPRTDDTDKDAALSALSSASVHDWHEGEFAVRYRLANSKDLLALTNTEEEAGAEKALLASCVIEARKTGEVIPATALPDRVVESLALAMGNADAGARMELQLTCPSCRHQWASLFDIGLFLWEELQTWSRRTIRDVHTLARAYGWSESAILSMSTMRRQTYLELLRS